MVDMTLRDIDRMYYFIPHYIPMPPDEQFHTLPSEYLRLWYEYYSQHAIDMLYFDCETNPTKEQKHQEAYC